MEQQFIKDKEKEFVKAIEHLKGELAGLRTGRANTGIVDHLEVEYYGTKTPLNQMAQITVPEARMITIQPYDKATLNDIVKAIQVSNVGINPNNDGNLIRLIVPPMTEERRKELVKVISQVSEKTRVSIRNVREELWRELQRKEKDSDISEDDKISGKEQLQKMVDKYNEEVKKLTEAKEKEVMTI
jgi:ribosome recycling factor